MSNVINPAAAVRISSSEMTGPKLLAMFQALANQMELIGSEGNFAQFQFVSDPDELQEGDLIPELHFSLRRYTGPLISAKMDVEESE